MMQSQSISPLTLSLTSDKIGPDDPRYAHLAHRGFNKRFIGTTACVRIVQSSEHVVDAVQDAVRDTLRVAVRSGGHCLEGFVADPPCASSWTCHS